MQPLLDQLGQGQWLARWEIERGDWEDWARARHRQHSLGWKLMGGVFLVVGLAVAWVERDGEMVG